MHAPIYITLAGKLEELIHKEVYKAGDRLPSLRSLHKEHGISVGTILQAFTHLLDKGLIDSKEKSGYFVRYQPKERASLPATIPSSLSARKVHIDQVLQSLRRDGTGKDFVSFGNALPDHRLLPFNGIKRAIQQISRDTSGSYLGLEDPKGNLSLRGEIAKRSFTWKGSLHADDLVITNGATEAIILCLKALTREGDTVLVQDPCFYGIMQTLEFMNVRVVTIPCHSRTGIDLADLERVCGRLSVKACILVSNFNNPNGASMSSEKKKAIASWAAKKEIPIIEDDLYGDLFLKGKRPDTIKTYDKKGWVLYCNSFAKTLAPGFRIGWCAPGRFLYEVARYKSMHNGSVNNLTQRALGVLLHSGVYERHLQKFRLELHKNMQRTVALIGQHFPEGTKWSHPEGGLVVWVELPASINTASLQDAAWQKGISFAPGEIFSARGGYENYLRISYCRLWDARVEAALKKLGLLFKNVSASPSLK